MMWISAEHREIMRLPVPFLRRCSLRLSVSLLVGFISLAALPAPGQSPQGSPTNQNSPEVTTTTTTDVPEISSEETTQSFKVKVNLVELRVVVRDAKGNAVGKLKQDDFVLLDDKKTQTIKRFEVERSEAPSTSAPAGQSPVAESPNDLRSRLARSWRLAYLFDDINSTVNDVMNARTAAEQAIDSLAPGEQLAIFTLSGQGMQDFTSDKERLRGAVAQLQARPQGGSIVSDCPPINYYMADQLKNNGDPELFKVVLQQVIGCQFGGNTPQNGSEPVPRTGGPPPRKSGDQLLMEGELQATQEAIDRVYRAGEAQADLIFQSINQILRHVSEFGGQRTLVLLSPGMYLGRLRQADLSDSLNRAIERGVVINTLDLRGVVAQQAVGADISQKPYGSSLYVSNMINYEAASNIAQADPLMQMANATGGRYFHNNNDISAGLAKLSAEPEFSYLLAFTPQELKNDGKFHTLKVELKQPSGYSVQARKGYYAPKQGGLGGEANREVAEAVFGRDEIHELPLRVQTQFFKTGEETAQLAVLVRVDVRHMQFRKADGRNLNDLTVVAALFDRNDNFVSGKNNTVRMHIKDETLATKLNSGITLRNNFDISPGSYLVRVVARDTQGKMTTQSDVIDIP